MVKNLDTIFEIPANTEIINEEDLQSEVIFQPLHVFGQILIEQFKQLVHHVAVVEELTAIIHPAYLITYRRGEIRFADTSFPVDTNIQTAINEMVS